MDPIATIERHRLSPRGGVYRQLSLFTESCIAEGYGKTISSIAGMNYGASSAIGNSHGMHTMYDIDAIMKRVAHNMRRRRWVTQTCARGVRVCRQFMGEFEQHLVYARTDPRAFLQFIIRSYPRYMAGIGALNLFWRYLEFATPDMPQFPKRALHTLSTERNAIAKIYPYCEKAIGHAVSILGKRLDMRPRLLQMMTREELRQTILASRLTVSRAELEKRAKGYVYLYVKGKEFVSARRTAIREIRKYFDSSKAFSGILQGVSVSRGSARGTVVTKVKRRRWPRHPIFVTPMTHPGDVQFLKRIVGLITDEGGGILSHAAIVARELKIPCVISTKIATQVFKDGDRVEVDATRGTVTKLFHNT